MSQPAPPRMISGRLGPVFASIWLFFLLDPLTAAWRDRDEAHGWIGLIGVVSFAVVYLAGWIQIRAGRGRLVHAPPRAWGIAYLGGLALLSVLIVAALGEVGLACVVYLGVAAVITFPLVVAAVIVLLLAGATVLLAALADWGSQVGTVFGLLAASIAIFGLRAMMSRNIELIKAQQENADLAVENERTRFSRDLHDILGHSLTVITVKAELAQRLMDVDVDRARSEIADLERLSRDAMADVRRAVQGYREITLPGELARARNALASAEIEAVLPNSTDEVPSELRDLFAWTVREGVTNVIRHSRARRCEVVLTTTSAEVRDDGTGCTSDGTGSGLLGLTERAQSAGATVVTRALEPGWSLAVIRRP